MNQVTNVSKNKATLDGRSIRIKPVTQKTMRGGKFYIRLYTGFGTTPSFEIIILKGRPYRSHNSMRVMTDYCRRVWLGKQRIKAAHAGYMSDKINKTKYCYMNDLGIAPGHRGGAVLYEYNQNTLNLVTALRNQKLLEQSKILMHGQ